MKSELTLMRVKCNQSMVGKDIFITSTEKSYKTQLSIPYAVKIHAAIKYGSKHNLERHDLFFSCVSIVSENLGCDEDEIVYHVKLDAMHIKRHITHRQKVYTEVKSISFSEMTLEEADNFYSKAFDILAGYLKIDTEKLIEEAKLRMKTPRFCMICGKRATQKHHKFSQTKWAIAKYGKKLINAEFNIVNLCHNCHASHANLNKKYILNENKFVEIAKKEGLL